MPLKILAEALGRLEHKVDILIDLLKKAQPGGWSVRIPAVGELGFTCPVCNQQVEYQIDSRAEVLVRKCGCRTGKVAPIKLEPLPPVGGRHGSGRSESE